MKVLEMPEGPHCWNRQIGQPHHTLLANVPSSRELEALQGTESDLQYESL